MGEGDVRQAPEAPIETTVLKPAEMVGAAALRARYVGRVVRTLGTLDPTTVIATIDRYHLAADND